MIVLGLSHPISLNGAACLLVDGQLVAFAEEERFTRQKHAPHVFPARAIDACLAHAGVPHHAIDATAIGFAAPGPGAPATEDVNAYVAGTLTGARNFAFRTQLQLLQTDTLIRSWGQRLYFDHHLAHAASTLIPSGFPSANVITLDGWGLACSGLLGWQRDGGDVEVWRRIPVGQSWGMLYELVTYTLGFRPHSGEGKTMGLAAYGKPSPDALPDFCEAELGLPDVDRYRAHLANVAVRPPGAPLEQRHRDLAATVQAYYERSLIKIARALKQQSGLGRFALAGGVALNCTGNGALAQQDFVEDLFIQPAAHDAGTALGAAILAHRELTGAWPQARFTHASWGPSFSEDAIRAGLDFAGAPYVEGDGALLAAQALAEDKLVGWFQGRAEVGPRALGNRSILAHPGMAANKDRVNLRVKRREPWRPFAPSVLKPRYHELFDARLDSPFMIQASQAREAWRPRIPAVVHVDGSARPQTVSAETNAPYDRLLRAFDRLTGLPVVLNTSFNLEDEPIVSAPDHAIATFFRSGLQVLVMGNFAVTKPNR